MNLNESIVEDAALESFLLRQGYGGQIGDQTRFARTLIPTFSRREKEKDGEVVLVGRLREALRASGFHGYGDCGAGRINRPFHRTHALKGATS